MNRNTEAHFSQIPSANIPRSRFDLSFSHKTTFNFGDVCPVFCKPVYPGDTFDVTTSKIVRLQTLLTPVMDNAYLDTYFFYVPYRLVWDHWEEFMGANKSSAWTPNVSYTMPVFYTSTSTGVEVGSIADHLGIPVGLKIAKEDVNAPYALPFRAYALICDTFFRDQNVSDPILITTSDTSQIYYPIAHAGDFTQNLQHGGTMYRASRYHDYFSSCLPAPQRGPSVTVPTYGSLPVGVGEIHSVVSRGADDLAGSTVWHVVKPNNTYLETLAYGTDQGVFGYAATTADHKAPSDVGPNQTKHGMNPANLWAFANSDDLAKISGVRSDVGLGIDINALRLAALTQSYYEALARGGARYDEIIRQFFGVISPDGRLNNPEYLGGSRVQLNVHEVTNTAQSEQDFLGDLGAMSVTADTHGDFVKSFTEHGVVIGVCVARYDNSYHQGIEKFWTVKDQFEMYNPMFARIGEQPVYDVELYADSASLSSRSVFGYQEAWADLRHSRNMVTGLFRPNVPGSFGHWTFTDNYGSKPVLSESWMMVDKTNVDRTLAVTSQLSDQIFADFYFDFKATRPMPMYSIPGAIGAF